MHGIASDTNGSISLFSIIQRRLYCVEVVDISSWRFLLLIARANVNTSVELTEALFPRIWIDRVFHFNEMKFAWLRVEEWKIVLKYDHIQALPKFCIVSDCLKSLANQRKPTEILLEQIRENCQKNFIWHFILQVVSGRLRCRIRAG